MSEITRQDLISDDALEAPAILTKELEKLLVVVGQVKTSSKEIGQGIGGAGLKQSKEDTNKLTEEMRVLATVSKQIKTETAKQSDEYQKQATILKDLKEQQKQRNALGDKEAINVRAATSSIKELEAALKANRAAYAALRTEEERNTKTGKDLSKAIEEQYNEVVNLNKGMGVHKDTVGNYEGALKGLKSELKAAKNEMVGIAATMGESSKEFIAASQRAGELQDRMNAVSEATKDLSGGSGFEKASAQSKRFTEQLSAGDFQGATASIKSLATTIRGMTFKEAIAGLGGFGSAMASLGKALLTNPIFLMGAAIAALVIAFNYFKEQGEKLTLSTIERLDREEKALQSRYDLEIRLAGIARKETTDLEIAKNEEFIKLQKEKFEAINNLSRVQYALATNLFFTEKSFNEKRSKQNQEIKDSIVAAENEITVLKAAAKQKEIDDAKRVTDKLIEDAKQRASKFKALLTEMLASEEGDVGAFNVEIFTEEMGQKTIDQLNATFNSTKQVINQAFDDELAIKAKHDADMLKTDQDYAENRRALFISQVKEVSNSLGQAYQIYSQFSQAINLLQNNQSQQRILNIESEINKERERAANEILIAGGNAEAKARIEAQSALRIEALERKRRQEQRQAAIRARDAAIIDAAVKTALAILNQLSTGDVYTAIPRAIAVGALGAIQIAAINAQPIPQYFKGTENHPGGLAMVGERGEELMVMPSGDVRLSPATATVLDLPRGTEVIPNEETMKMLAMAGISRPEISESRSDDRLLKELRSLKEVTAKNKPSNPKLTRNMATVYESRKVSETMTNKVRALSMGDFGL
jgi:hypothetical protein